KRVYTNEKWRRVVLLDEERFNLDVSDNLLYCHDLRKGATTFESSIYGRRRYSDWG
ncbi:unnamed protein product, partial [Heterotrigona itama]